MTRGGRPRKLLNVRSHLEHALLIEECFNKYGVCPLLVDELRKYFFVNRAILRARDPRNRKDFYVGAHHD